MEENPHLIRNREGLENMNSMEVVPQHLQQIG
jgi:hypothetical protein